MILAGTLLPDFGDERCVFAVKVYFEEHVPDFDRYEEIIGEQPELPKGLVWAHRLDHCPGSLFPEDQALEIAVERVRPNELTKHLMRKMRHERKVAA